MAKEASLCLANHRTIHPSELMIGKCTQNGNRLKANTSTTAASQGAPGVFANPITGSARVEFGKVAPMLLVGWGNLISRGGKHFSIPVEFGVVYHGDPKASLRMNPIGCPAGDFICTIASADSSVQNGFQQE